MSPTAARSTAEPPPSRGHSIEARLYAEDPAKNWQPQAGTVHRFDVPATRPNSPRSTGRNPPRLRRRRRLGRVDLLRPDAGQGHLVRARPDARPPACSPTRWPAPGSTACAPTATCWSTCCGTRPSSTAPPTPRSSTPTAWPSWPHRWPTDAPSTLSALAAALADAAHNRQRRNGIRRGAERLAQPRVGLPDQAVQRRRRREHEVRVPLHPQPAGAGRPRGRRRWCPRRRDRVVLSVDGVDRPFDVARYGDDVFVDSPLGPVHSSRCRASRTRTPRSRRVRCWRPCRAR